MSFSRVVEDQMQINNDSMSSDSSNGKNSLPSLPNIPGYSMGDQHQHSQQQQHPPQQQQQKHHHHHHQQQQQQQHQQQQQPHQQQRQQHHQPQQQEQQEHYQPQQQQQIQHLNQLMLPPQSDGEQPSSEIDSLLQGHRRKMIRRAANRRSAQQSRARKKALMGDLKVENQRLQKFADILDSQPELTFCIDKEGQITFMSDSALNYMKSFSGDETDEDPIHISQILTAESVGTVLDSIALIRTDQCVTRSINGDHDVNGCISSVQSVCYHDATGLKMVGYIRCSRLVKRAPFDDGDISPSAPIDVGPEKKKSKTSASVTIPLTAFNIAAASSANGGAFSFGGGNLNTNGDIPENKTAVSDTDEEFVCSIRPADSSFPHTRGSLFSSLLSTASIVANDLDLNISNNLDQPLPPQPHEYNYPLLQQRGNFPPQSYGPYSYQQKNNINANTSSQNSQNSQNRYLNSRTQPNGLNGSNGSNGSHNQHQGLSSSFYSQFQGSSSSHTDRSASIPADINNESNDRREGKEHGDWPL